MRTVIGLALALLACCGLSSAHAALPGPQAAALARSLLLTGADLPSFKGRAAVPPLDVDSACVAVAPGGSLAEARSPAFMPDVAASLPIIMSVARVFTSGALARQVLGAASTAPARACLDRRLAGQIEAQGGQAVRVTTRMLVRTPDGFEERTTARYTRIGLTITLISDQLEFVRGPAAVGLVCGSALKPCPPDLESYLLKVLVTRANRAVG